MTESLQLHELRPVGGTWTGLLFENPAAAYPLTLTWAFTIDFGDVRRDFGSTSPSLALDWVPMPGASWLSMDGRRISSASFAEPVEASVYYFEHHRYDSVELAVVQQARETIDVIATAAGDIDGLGLAEVTAEAELAFAGIYVQVTEVGADLDAASALLAGFTDVTGLRPKARGHNVVFELA